MKRIISILLIIFTVGAAITLGGCQGEDKSDEQLTVYCTSARKQEYEQLFKYYNNYCTANAKFGKPYQIKFVEFEDEETLYKKMTTETMAGGGPDIFLTAQYLPFEKMIGAGAFADIDELLESEGYKIDFSELNEKVMDAGVWNGKRYILPIVYSARVLIADKYSVKNIGLPNKNGSALTYDDIEGLLKYAEDSEVFPYDSQFLLRNLLYDYMDMQKKEVYFDNDDFKRNLETIKKLYKLELKRAENAKDMDEDDFRNNYYSVFENPQQSFESFMKRFLCNYTDDGNFEFYDEKVEKQNILYKGISKKKSDNRGYIDLGIAINKNTKQRKKVCEFIKFSLSNLGQSHMTSPYNSFAFNSSFPVNKKTFKKRLRNATNFEFVGGKVFNEYDSDMFNTYVEIAESVDELSLYNDASYYVTSIVGELIDQYLNDKLPQNKFIRQLSSATKFYLEE